EKGAYIAPTTRTTYRVQVAGTRENAVATVLLAAQETSAQVRGIRLAERSLEEAFLEVIQ
ncbi:MAG: hypothetical protein WCG75_10270, partial [Armatimonadota bacterium]